MTGVRISGFVTMACVRVGGAITGPGLRILAGAKHGGPEFRSPEVETLVSSFFEKHLQPTFCPK